MSTASKSGSKELDLTKLEDYTKTELVFFVKLLATKLERRTEELEMLKAKVSNRIGASGKKNPNVR